MPSNHLIFCHPLLLLPSIFPSIRVFSSESVLIRWTKYWSVSFCISPSNEYSGLISLRIDWLDLLAVQGTLKSLLQHHSSKASILRRSASLRHHFANKGPSNQSYGFSNRHVWMWELNHKEGWEPKIWCFELWYWWRLLRVPWTARRSNQSILREISPDSLEGLLLKLKLQYLGLLMWRTESLEKILMLGKIEGRRSGWQDEMVGWHHQLDGHEFEQALGVSDGQRTLACYSPWGRKELDMTEQAKWTELNWKLFCNVHEYLFIL